MSGGAGAAKGDIVSPGELLRKLFESGTGEWEMVGSDGRAVKFHQLILSEQVPHFRALFSHGGTLECANKQIVIPADKDIPGVVVEAFLRYVYYQDTEAMTSSFKTCADLIRLGHYYNTTKLVGAAAQVMKSIGALIGKLDWFSVEVLWKLYPHVWLWEEGHPSKKLLMDTIVAIIKRFCIKDPSDVLLPVTSCGDPVILSDLIVALARNHPPRSR